MKERLQQLLSEVGESFDYLKSDIRNLSRYMAELEELIESYRATQPASPLFENAASTSVLPLWFIKGRVKPCALALLI